MRTDHAVRRARRHLADGEVVIASALGTEADGRRRRVVLLTDQRLLVAGLRADPPVELALDGCTGAYEPGGGLLTLRQGETEIVLREVERGAAGRVVELLAQRRPRPEGAQVGRVPHVRIVEG